MQEIDETKYIRIVVVCQYINTIKMYLYPCFSRKFWSLSPVTWQLFCQKYRLKTEQILKCYVKYFSLAFNGVTSLLLSKSINTHLGHKLCLINR